MADRLYTSLKTDEIISALRSVTNLDKAVIAKMAFAYSITTQGKDVKESTDFSGGEMKRPTFVGSDEIFIRSLISLVYEQPEIDEADFYSNHSIVKNHVDNGAVLLWNLYHNNGEDVNCWYAELVNIIHL